MDNQFFNFHLDKACSSNTKVGFQSLNSDVAALKKTLGVCKGWAEQGNLKNGDVFIVYARYTETDTAEELSIPRLVMADGTIRDLPTAATAEDEIPY